MEFNYSEEQLALQDTLQRFISRDYDFDKRRAFSASPYGFSPEAWSQYAELGLLALPFPEDFGGLSGTAVDTMLVMEQFGKGLLLEPYLSTVVTCGGLIRDAGSDSLKKRLLPEIGAGKLKLALAGYEAAGRYDLAYVTCTAQESGGSWRLSGRKTVVLDGASADYFLVSARSAGKVYERDGISLFLVPKDAKGLTVGAYPTQSGARAADLGLENVAVGTDALIGAPGRALPIIERAVDRAIAALCAEAIGIINALNEATLNYLKTRKQFGVAIGSFQALKHKMADMLIAAEQAQSMAIIAAVHADSEDAADRRRAISAAKAYIGQAGRLVGQHAVQMHGGMGVVDELIVSHYFKRLTMIDLTFGDADYHLASFSDTLRPTA
ncbi:MAG TPA: acyl-CoA dehydrogenase family protein [Steroidobacteraceae bacterium]|jgi:alkylation response protein AidB-like acyl-CoA dehydrogenase|nr:acyl-CoA dehydrogenase family protein [Steroidobacteraceae bacterium]